MDGDVEYDPGWSTTQLVLNTLFSAVFAGAVAVLVTAVIERWGGTLGGILGTVPGTIVPMTVGVAIQADTNYEKVENALYVIPLGMTSAVFFLVLWRVIPPYLPKSWTFKRRLITMVCASLFGWLCWSTALYLGLGALQRAGFTIPQIGVCGAIALFLAGLVGACYKPVPSPKGTNKVTPVVYFARSTIAATSVGLAVLVSKWSDVLAGIFACFPAIFLTTMVSLWISQGEAMPTGAVGPMMLGSGAVYVYAIVFSIIFPYFNDQWTLPLAIVATTVSAWIFSVLSMSLPIYFGLKWRQRCSPVRAEGLLSVEVEEDSYEEEDDRYDDFNNEDARFEEETLGLKSRPSFPSATSYYGAIKH